MRAERRPSDRPPERPRSASRVAALCLGVVAITAIAPAFPADPAAEQREFDGRQKLFIRRAFNDDPSLAPHMGDIWVRVKGTVAILSGQVPSAMLKQRALFLAGEVKGIARVHGDDLQVVPQDGLSDLPCPFSEGTPPRGTLAGNHRDDRATQEPRKADLPDPGPVRPPLYEAVTLLPPVPLPGASAPPAESRPGENTLATGVETLRRKDARWRRVTVEVRKQSVYLRGTVARWDDANDLTNAVRRLPGVEAVILDDLRVNASADR